MATPQPVAGSWYSSLSAPDWSNTHRPRAGGPGVGYAADRESLPRGGHTGAKASSPTKIRASKSRTHSGRMACAQPDRLRRSSPASLRSPVFATEPVRFRFKSPRSRRGVPPGRPDRTADSSKSLRWSFCRSPSGCDTRRVTANATQRAIASFRWHQHPWCRPPPRGVVAPPGPYSSPQYAPRRIAGSSTAAATQVASATHADALSSPQAV